MDPIEILNLIPTCMEMEIYILDILTHQPKEITTITHKTRTGRQYQINGIGKLTPETLRTATLKKCLTQLYIYVKS